MTAPIVCAGPGCEVVIERPRWPPEATAIDLGLTVGIGDIMGALNE